MTQTEFRKRCLDTISPFYPDAEEWLDKNWERVIDAVKLHSGRSLLKSFENCVNMKGKLDFFFKDLARYMPREGVGAGLPTGETDAEYFARMGLSGSMARPLEKPVLTQEEDAECRRKFAELRERFRVHIE